MMPLSDAFAAADAAAAAYFSYFAADTPPLIRFAADDFFEMLPLRHAAFFAYKRHC